MDDNFNYSVYIKTDKNGFVSCISSSAFICGQSGWIRIDAGEGEKYRYPQNGYFSKPLTDENGIRNYRYENGEVIERSEQEKASELSRINAAAEIKQLKARLRDTDYNIIKIVEGAATAKEMADVIVERREWRRRINELEELIA